MIMQLIGMLDSAYVRRVAITMQLLAVSYEHRSLSVFSTYTDFRALNPQVRAPTLVCDDGFQLLDSTLIIDHVETLAGRSLMPQEPLARRRALRLIGLALVACEKVAQAVHERRLRPAERPYRPWSRRINEQLVAALEAIEHMLEEQPLEEGNEITQAGVTVAVAWRFLQMLAPEGVLPLAFPRIAAYSALAEQLPAFIAAPPL